MSRKLIFLVGFLLLAVPLLLQVWESRHQENIVSTYWEEIEDLQDSELENSLQEARKYNENLYEMTQTLSDELELEESLEQEYQNMLHLSGTGIMGTIEIPKISVRLPIYHGTSDDVLTKGIGHLKSSSLPVGGENVHSVLTGHRGLPGAQLFTRLDEMEKEDIFYVKVYDEILVYRVINIQVVKPENVEVLEIQEGKDLVSLITCTPYGLNTHRLVVTGERIEIQEEVIEEMEKAEANKTLFSARDLLVMGILVLFLAAAIWKWILGQGKRKKKIALFLLLLCLPMNTLASEGSVEIVTEKGTAQTVQFVKVADLRQETFALKEEYRQSGIDLNKLQSAAGLQDAAKRLQQLAEKSTQEIVIADEKTMIAGLSEGVYLFQIQGEKIWDPVLIYIPTRIEGTEEVQYDIMLIPKCSEKSAAPDTGWNDYTVFYIIVMLASLFLVVWRLQLLIKTHK